MTAVIDGRQPASGAEPLTGERETELADLTGLSLAELLTIENPVLAHSLRKVIAEENQRQNIVAGFQSAI